MKPNFLQECYDRFVTPETARKAGRMANEECGLIILNEQGEYELWKKKLLLG